MGKSHRKGVSFLLSHLQVSPSPSHSSFAMLCFVNSHSSFLSTFGFPSYVFRAAFLKQNSQVDSFSLPLATKQCYGNCFWNKDDFVNRHVEIIYHAAAIYG